MDDFAELNRLIFDMESVPREAEPLVRVAVQKTSADIKRDGMLFAPVDTGFLEGSITYETFIDGMGVTGEIGPTAKYGEFVELGTEKMAPQAYMGPAFDRHSYELDEAMAQIAGGFLS